MSARPCGYGLTAVELASDAAVLAALGVPPTEAIVVGVPSVVRPQPPPTAMAAAAAAAAAAGKAASALPAVILPMLPKWQWVDAAIKAGGRFMDSGAGAATAHPREIRLEKQRRRKRDRMLYNFWIPLLLGTFRC